MDEMLKKHLQAEFDHVKKVFPDFVTELEKYLALEGEPFELYTENMRLKAELLSDRLKLIEGLFKLELEWKKPKKCGLDALDKEDD